MFKDDWIYVSHMLDMSRKEVDTVTGKTRDGYNDDEILRMALTHFIQVIGEAARKVSAEFQATHPQIPWREIVGTRHRIVHGYLNIDEDLVWEIVTHDLPALIRGLEKIIPSEY